MANKEVYTPMEKILIEGAQRLQHHNKLLLLLDYEMEQLIKPLEEQVALQEELKDEVEL